jgi:hypothetical protein
MENALYNNIDLGVDMDSRIVIVGPNGRVAVTVSRNLIILVEFL